MGQMRYVWALGETYHPVVIRGLNDLDRWEAVLGSAWELEGPFGWNWIDMGEDGTFDKAVAEFQFADPNAAFAFKMRWG